MVLAPRTRYASCGETDIAYQVFGDGPTDLVLLPGPSIPIDTIDAEPSMYRFHRRLASFARVIRLDQRGMGLSSRVSSADMLGPKLWAKDVIAVMNAIDCERATIVAPGFTSMTGMVLAADYPERVSSLVIINGAARTLYAPDYPMGATVETTDPFTTVAIDPTLSTRASTCSASLLPASPMTPRSAPGGTWPATAPPRRAWPSR